MALLWILNVAILSFHTQQINSLSPLGPFYIHFISLNVFCQVARASLLRNNDPLDAAIFYLAMKKKAVVWGLYR